MAEQRVPERAQETNIEPSERVPELAVKKALSISSAVLLVLMSVKNEPTERVG